jgi:S-(hydroxymethyl)glutathione dehydrogenase/alcohol dehydrogenase
VDAEAAVLWKVRDPWSVEPIVVDPPQADELLVRIEATGLCHSDDHAVTGDVPFPFPHVGGHEGSGVVEAIGPGVEGLVPGDHVVLWAVPPCGRCHQCAVGRSNLCRGPGGPQAGVAQPRFRLHARGQDLTQVGGLGTFSSYAVVSGASAIKIDPDIPFEVAALLGCAVATGWGSAVYLAEVRPGDAVVVIGAGGVGVNAIQGAVSAGADIIVAVDPVEFKQKQAIFFGATHTAGSMEDAKNLVADLTGGRMADAAILSTGVADGGVIAPLLALVGPGRIAVVTSISPYANTSVEMSLIEFTMTQKTLRGNAMGGVNAYRDIPLLLGLYRQGKLKLDELITSTYPLREINQGYADMHAGKNLRGVVVHSH